MMQLAEQMREAIRQDGRSLYQLAKDTGIDRGVLSRFMNAERSITVDTAGPLVEALGIELRPVGRKGR